MIGLAALVWLPVPVLAGLSLAVIALHNTLDGVDPARFGDAAPLWNLLHQPGAFSLAGMTVIVGYPLMPWIAVMALGILLGPAVSAGAGGAAPAPHRRSGRPRSWGSSWSARSNVYGDPAPWTTQPSPVYTALSFLNTTKYPPSLEFLLMTLGPTLLALAWFDRPGLKASNPLVVFGRVPLFYFILHFYLAHAAAALLAFIRYGGAARAFVFHPVPSMGGPSELFPPRFGYDLWVVYAVWAAIVVALYPVCRWFARIKAKRRDWWLSYL